LLQDPLNSSTADRYKSYINERARLLSTASSNYQSLRSNPQTVQYYVDGELYATWDQVPDDIPGAQNLHFLVRK
jgi:hypothetical protein